MIINLQCILTPPWSECKLGLDDCKLKASTAWLSWSVVNSTAKVQDNMTAGHGPFYSAKLDRKVKYSMSKFTETWTACRDSSEKTICNSQSFVPTLSPGHDVYTPVMFSNKTETIIQCFYSFQWRFWWIYCKIEFFAVISRVQQNSRVQYIPDYIKFML